MEKSRFKIIILSLVTLSVISGGVLIYLVSSAWTVSFESLRNDGYYQYETPIDLDDFVLVNHQEMPFTRADLAGKWSFVFFGYTFCPDICPLTLATLRQFYNLLDENGMSADVQVVMISLDPKRDTPEVLSNYVTYFNQDFIGATGDYADIYGVSRQMNVAFTYTPIDDENYLVTHNGEIMLVDPSGRDVGFFKAPHDPEVMQENFLRVKKFLAQQR